MILRAFSFCFLTLLLWLPCVTIGQTDQEQSALKDYLRTHRLYVLYANLLEDELLNATDETRQKEIALSLAQLYAWELNNEPEQFQFYSDRLDELVRDFPDAIPAATRISIVFGRYRQAKTVFEEWIWDRSNAEMQAQVSTRFANIVQRATDAVVQIDEQLADAGLDLSTRRELESAQAQFRYLAGWARYYRSITNEDPERRLALVQAAEKDFLQLLELADSSSLMDMSPQWWALNSEWTCRLLLGLGMTSQALERGPEAEFCFNLLSESRVPNSIRSSQRVWQFHSFVFPGQLEQADVMVRKWEPNRIADGDIAFWSSVAIAGISWPQPTAPTNNMIRVGLSGLARANEFQILDEIHDRFPNIGVTGKDFFARWMDGYSALRNAQGQSAASANLEAQQNLARAQRELLLALESDSSVAPVYRARCRYHLGFALYLDRRFDEAAEQFRETSTVLRSQDPQLAEHAFWMRCQALQRLAAKDISWARTLGFALGEFQQLFPDSENAPQAAFMQIMNQLDSEPGEQAMSTLLAIKPGDANYHRALFEICRLSHRMWSEATEEETKQASALETISAAEEYVAKVSPDEADSGSAARFVRICLLAADVCLQQDAVSDADGWLKRCENWMASVATREIGSDFQFLQMNIAARQSDDDRESMASQWLLRNTTNEAHLRAALISQARLLDRQLAQTVQSGGDPDPRQLDLVIDAYQRLVDEYSPDNTALSSDNVSRTALFRLAELQMKSGRYDQARNSFSRLHRAMPDQLAFISGLAMAEMRQGNLRTAAGHWRTIASGFSPGSETWLDAKYHLILCLADSQPDNAKAVLQQVHVLIPELPTEWLQPFAELQSRLADMP